MAMAARWQPDGSVSHQAQMVLLSAQGMDLPAIAKAAFTRAAGRRGG
jgi:hypothetical protein